jgi:hypothetical protein
MTVFDEMNAAESETVMGEEVEKKQLCAEIDPPDSMRNVNLR